MGSRITRTLSITDRQRRIQPSSQQQVKSFIKAMSATMFSFLIFGLGFLTSHSNEAHQHCLEYLAIATISALILNATNQQFCTICGWGMVVVQTLVLGERFRLVFAVGQFMTLYALLTGLFNYYGGTGGWSRNVVASGLAIIGAVVLGIGHCSSHFIRQLKNSTSTTPNMPLQQQLNFGLRFVLCFLGIMIVALTVMGHVHIRNRRFVPLPINEQVKYINSIKIGTKFEIVLLGIGLRGMILNIGAMQRCVSGGYLVVILGFTVGVVGCFAFLWRFVEARLGNTQQTLNLATIVTYLLLLIVIPMHLYKITYLLTYPLSLCLLLLLITHLTNKIEQDHRINYILSFIAAMICQANNIQHIHSQSQYENIMENCVVMGICVGIGLGIGYFWRGTGSGSYKVVGSGQMVIQH